MPDKSLSTNLNESQSFHSTTSTPMQSDTQILISMNLLCSLLVQMDKCAAFLHPHAHHHSLKVPSACFDHLLAANSADTRSGEAAVGADDIEKLLELALEMIKGLLAQYGEVSGIVSGVLVTLRREKRRIDQMLKKDSNLGDWEKRRVERVFQEEKREEDRQRREREVKREKLLKSLRKSDRESRGKGHAPTEAVEVGVDEDFYDMDADHGYP